MKIRLPALIFLCVLSILPGSGRADELWAFIGTYTPKSSSSQGIYAARFDPSSGIIREPILAAEAEHPSFLAVHPTRPLLYAVGETSDFGGEKTGSVSAYRIDADSGRLTLLNRQASGGEHPCHLTVGPEGNFLFVANYTGGSTSALRIQADGSLSPLADLQTRSGFSADPKRQTAPHVHSVDFDPSGNFLYIADLGTDEIEQYSFDPQHVQLTLESTLSLNPGSGPRHLAFHANQPWAFALNELSNTVLAMTVDRATGQLTPRQSLSALPGGTEIASAAAEIQIHPSGSFLYTSNRGHDSLSRFRIDPVEGTLAYEASIPVAELTPRHFTFDPSGRYLLVAGQRSNSIAVLPVDPQSGDLSQPTSRIQLDRPVCIQFFNPSR